MILELLLKQPENVEAIYGCAVKSHGLRTLKHETVKPV